MSNYMDHSVQFSVQLGDQGQIIALFTMISGLSLSFGLEYLSSPVQGRQIKMNKKLLQDLFSALERLYVTYPMHPYQFIYLLSFNPTINRCVEQSLSCSLYYMKNQLLLTLRMLQLISTGKRRISTRVYILYRISSL